MEAIMKKYIELFLIFFMVGICFLEIGMDLIKDKNIEFRIMIFICGVIILAQGLRVFFKPKHRGLNPATYFNKNIAIWGKQEKPSKFQIILGFISGMVNAEISIMFILHGIVCLIYVVLSFKYPIIDFRQFHFWFFSINLFLGLPISLYSFWVYLKLEDTLHKVFDIEKIESQFNQPQPFKLNISIKKDWNLNRAFLIGLILLCLTAIFSFNRFYSIEFVLALVILCAGIACLLSISVIPIVYTYIIDQKIWKKYVKRLKLYISLSTAFSTLGTILVLLNLQLKWI